ncbi:helix-turn-helix transcriptional regulator [Amycolatopsis circi]|uniref:helix-turn-helix transcriptional regulator n=1 Tax=Amycolatopsis circi TaxID=871959 RepID=UPI000E22A009|nr:helix-turn-helix transcriptional regulator [Amycolatopsis circi]
MSTDASRQELARFLRSRRERIAPSEVGLPPGTRRRIPGLRREEVAVLAGVSPTWYTYLEQARGIQPSREVLDSLARVLRLSEDERRYIHRLALGGVVQATPLDAEVPLEALTEQVVGMFEESPYPVYAGDNYGDILAWNPAACEWYEDWGALPREERNILRWMLVSPAARTRLPDWEADTRDAVARWRSEMSKHPNDPRQQAQIAEFARLSPEFRAWWGQHRVVEHRSRVRRLRHDRLGAQALRIMVIYSPEIVPVGVVLHLPTGSR